MEWHDLRKEKPTKNASWIYAKVEFPAYFEFRGKRKTDAKLLIDSDYIAKFARRGFIPYPLDLKSDQKNWKWKINPIKHEHYEDFLMWNWETDYKKTIDEMPNDYQFYSKEYNNEWKTFKEELPALGTNVIVSVEDASIICKAKTGYVFEPNISISGGSPLFPVGIKIDLQNKDINWYWSY